jgi:hypothetical protein
VIAEPFSIERNPLGCMLFIDAGAVIQQLINRKEEFHTDYLIYFNFYLYFYKAQLTMDVQQQMIVV